MSDLVRTLDGAEELLRDLDLDVPLDAITRTAQVERLAKTALVLMVATAREDGATWQQVADALGLHSRQAAEARYGT